MQKGKTTKTTIKRHLCGGGLLLCPLIIFAVGFSSWTANPQLYPSASIEADKVNLNINGCDYVTDANIAKFSYYPGYGFLEGGEYKSSFTMKGDITFDIAKMKNKIETFKNASTGSDDLSVRRFSLETNVSMDGYTFSVSKMAISSSTYTKNQSSDTNHINIEVVGIDETESITDFKLDFTFKLSYESDSEFPTIDKSMLVKLTPGEYAL